MKAFSNDPKQKVQRSPIIGQEVVCPDGLGRVIACSDESSGEWVQVSTYFNDRQCKWAPKNVHLVPIPGLGLGDRI